MGTDAKLVVRRLNLKSHRVDWSPVPDSHHLTVSERDLIYKLSFAFDAIAPMGPEKLAKPMCHSAFLVGVNTEDDAALIS